MSSASSRWCAPLAFASTLAFGATTGAGLAQAGEPVVAAREAENDEEHAARALFAEAVGLAEAGRWAEARDRYRRSLEVKFSPETLYSLGVAQKQTGAFVEALQSFERFLEEDFDHALEPFRLAARRAVAELEGRVGHVTVRVEAAPRGLAIAIDDDLLAPPEARGIRVNPGFHTIQVTAPGHAPRVLTLAVEPGEHERVHLDYRGAPPDTDGVGWTLVGLGAGLGAAGIVTALVGVTQPDPSAPGSAMTITGSVIGSVGAFGTGLGVLFLLDEPAGDDVLASFEVAPASLRMRF